MPSMDYPIPKDPPSPAIFKPPNPDPNSNNFHSTNSLHTRWTTKKLSLMNLKQQTCPWILQLQPNKLPYISSHKRAYSFGWINQIEKKPKTFSAFPQKQTSVCVPHNTHNLKKYYTTNSRIMYIHLTEEPDPLSEATTENFLGLSLETNLCVSAPVWVYQYNPYRDKTINPYSCQTI